MKNLYLLHLLFCISTFFAPTHLTARESGLILENNAKYVKIPIEIQNNLILLPVRINDSFEMKFILDTGVRTTILIEPLIASFLEIDSLETIKIRGLGEGEPINAALAKDIRIELPGVIGQGSNLIILPEGIVSYSGMFGQQVYGIIGYELFRHFIVEINYQREYIKLYDPFRVKEKRGRKWKEMPISINSGKPYIQASVTPYADENDIKTSWLLDTGSSQAVSMYFSGFKIRGKKLRTLLGRGLNGNIYGDLSRVHSVKIGDFTFNDVIVGFPDPEALGLINQEVIWYGNIGSDILSRFTLVFDYLRKKVLIRKNPDFKDPFYYNLSGMELIGSGILFNSFFVTYIRPESPAYKAGIRVGDEILSINGISVKQISIGEMYTELNKKVGKKINVKYRRGAETDKLSFKLVSDI